MRTAGLQRPEQCRPRLRSPDSLRPLAAAQDQVSVQGRRHPPWVGERITWSGQTAAPLLPGERGEEGHLPSALANLQAHDRGQPTLLPCRTDLRRREQDVIRRIAAAPPPSIGALGNAQDELGAETHDAPAEQLKAGRPSAVRPLGVRSGIRRNTAQALEQAQAKVPVSRLCS